MNSIMINKKNTLLVAHRGLSGLERENTKEAFILAGKSSYYGIETDIHVTKDGKYIVCHDDDIHRVTGVNLIIEDNNYDDIVKHKIYGFNSNENILEFPKLDDYIDICKKYNKHCFLELKNEMKEECIYDIIDKLIKKDWYKNTTIISFSLNNLLAVRNRFFDIEVQLLADKVSDDLFEILINKNIGLDIYYKGLSRDIIEKAHNNNLKVNCWTVDKVEDAERLIDLGVDLITTNILE